MFRKFLLFSLVILSVLSAVRFFDNVDYWIIDIFSHFPVQYALLALILLSICLWKKIFSLVVLAGFLFVLNSSVLFDFGKFAEASGQAGETFKVYSANIQRSDKDFSRLTRELEEIDADIVLLLEVTPGHLEKLQTLISSFPYHVEYTPFGKLDFGSVLLSKFTILDSNVTQLTDLGNLLIEAVLDINHKKTSFYAVHASNPSMRKYFQLRKRNLLGLVEKISRNKMPVIVAGDFNATPYSPIFRRLLKATGLRDSRTGFGWQPTWPTHVPFFWLPIDHILVTPDIQVHNRTTGSYIGSDHYPVIAEMSMIL
jgi:endonuclease/exonuclease/phosphatase (EEP) superfamily protein YafD